MNKINSPIINKKYQHNMIMMIVAAVLVVLSFICFAAGDLGSALRNDEAAVHFSEAYNDDDLDEGKRVMIYATEDPVQIGYYDSSEAYYFVYDYYEDIYIIRCSEDQADAISKEIADELFISENTVKYHKKNMLQKTGFSSTIDLAFYMISNGWINPMY